VLPPQADGAPVLLFVSTPLQPPVTKALLLNHVLNAALTDACVWQALTMVVPTWILIFGVDGAATVNVAWQVVVNGAQELVYVNVTVVEPPQALGAPVLLFVRTPLQPPLAVAVASHVANAVLTAACEVQACKVVLIGQVSVAGGTEETVKVAWQVKAENGQAPKKGVDGGDWA
jgi:hypothetical protein